MLKVKGLGTVTVPAGDYLKASPAKDYEGMTVAAYASSDITVTLGRFESEESVDVEGLESLSALAELQYIAPKDVTWNMDEYGMYAQYDDDGVQHVVFVLSNKDGSTMGFVDYQGSSEVIVLEDARHWAQEDSLS